jgi:DNA-directed RNA polymerase specialized sigma subunit
MDIETRVIEELGQYNRICGRIKVLEKYPIGAGMYLTESHSEDDRLQALHRQLRQIPSHMYLNGREQHLQTLAHVYLADHPNGTKSQSHAVQCMEVADVDRELLKDLHRRIQKVIETRSGQADGMEGMLERLSELHELERQKERIDFVLETMSEYKQQYADLLRLRYIEEREVKEVMQVMNIAHKTFHRWRSYAIQEYAKLCGMT